MWDLCGWPEEKIKLDEATVTLDEKNNYYTLKVQGDIKNGPWIVLYVDPAKDFIPVKKEFIAYDGTLLLTYECSNFHQMPNGLWIPYRYSWFDPRMNYGAVYEVKEIRVNEPIDENLFDFDFPLGTIVIDEISDLRYRIEDPNAPESTKSTIKDLLSEVMAERKESYLLESKDTLVSTPAKEEDLQSAGSEAKELLGANKQSPVAEIVLGSIEVLPTIVLVTPDKSEYKLVVKKQDSTKPELLNYKFESAQMKLSSFKNFIETNDELIVKVNILESHTGFIKGVLVLQFAEQEKPFEITFVCPPLSVAI